MKVAFTILGEPASKANSRAPATVGKPGQKRTIWIKSEKARGYEATALLQIPPAARVQFAGDVRVTMRIYYGSRRPDLDESLILDILQDRYRGTKRARVLIQRGVYVNDRQVKEKHIFWALDPANPRTEVEIEALTVAPAPPVASGVLVLEPCA